MATLLIGIVAGTFGWAYIVYGRRTARFVPAICGVLLCVYPYFVDGWIALCGIGAVLLAVPFFVDG